VKWKGYENPTEDTWGLTENLTNCLDVIHGLHRIYPNRPCGRQNLLSSSLTFQHAKNSTPLR
jgi:hypothetical protein